MCKQRCLGDCENCYLECATADIPDVEDIVIDRMAFEEECE